jgi:hypothetical protein
LWNPRLDHRQSSGPRLREQDVAADAVDGDAFEALSHRGEQTHDIEFAALAQRVQGPGRVLAAAPGHEDGSRAHGRSLTGLMNLNPDYSGSPTLTGDFFAINSANCVAGIGRDGTGSGTCARCCCLRGECSGAGR